MRKPFRIIDRYLLRESLPPLIFGLVLYSSLAVVSVTIPRMEWVVGTPVLPMLGWLGMQLPQALVQTFPIALVLAVLLAFGRLSTDNELASLQAGGVPLRRISNVFVAMALVSSLIVLSLNQFVIPYTNTQTTRLYWELTAGQTGLFRLTRQMLPVDDFTLHFERSEQRGQVMADVRVERWDGDVLTLLRADTARFQGVDLVLTGYRIDSIDLNALDQPGESPADTLARLVRLRNVPADPAAELTITTSTDLEELITRFGQGGFEDARSITHLYADAQRQSLSADQKRQTMALFHRKLAEPFTNLALLLVAIPLSLKYARTRGVAFGMSLIVTLVWYLFYTFGTMFAQSGQLPVWLGAWLGNIVFAGVGVALLMRRAFR